jgi:hypothetical protein
MIKKISYSKRPPKGLKVKCPYKLKYFPISMKETTRPVGDMCYGCEFFVEIDVISQVVDCAYIKET